MVWLRDGDKKVYCYAAHIVAAAFLGPRPSGKVVAHGNDDPSDDRIENLRYATYKENSADTFKNGGKKIKPKQPKQKSKVARGERHFKAKLTDADVLRIRSVCVRNDRVLGVCALSREYGVNQAVISRIVNRVNWKHL